MRDSLKSWFKRALVGFVALASAAVLWLPCVHFLFRKPLSNFYQEAGISPKARQLAARHVQLWTQPDLRQIELRKMRSSNEEWDFMGRTFLVWSLANMALREPQMKQAYLSVIDQIVRETVKIEQERAFTHF